MGISIKLSWDKNTDDTSAYEVARRVGYDGDWVENYAVIPQPPYGSRVQWTDSNLELRKPARPSCIIGKLENNGVIYVEWDKGYTPPHQSHAYRVRSLHAAGSASEWSEPIGIKPSSKITKYEYQIKNHATNVPIAEGFTTETEISVHGLPQNIEYIALVRAFDLAGQVSEWATSDKFGLPSTLTNLTISEIIE